MGSRSCTRPKLSRSKSFTSSPSSRRHLWRTRTLRPSPWCCFSDSTRWAKHRSFSTWLAARSLARASAPSRRRIASMRSCMGLRTGLSPALLRACRAIALSTGSIALACRSSPSSRLLKWRRRSLKR
eukprot:Amastigsp_a2363_36.p4 type:complete len:127 gc:universal Amastigsp_a2363_36:1529-1149(-)